MQVFVATAATPLLVVVTVAGIVIAVARENETEVATGIAIENGIDTTIETNVRARTMKRRFSQMSEKKRDV